MFSVRRRSIPTVSIRMPGTRSECRWTSASPSITTPAGRRAPWSLTDTGTGIGEDEKWTEFRVCLRPLVPGIDADNLEQAFISYIDVGRSKFIRRRELRVGGGRGRGTGGF